MMNDIKFRSQSPGDVAVMDHLGSDLRIWQAARASYGADDSPETTLKHAKFIANLVKNKHWVPFEHCSITYLLHAPIFVFRQLFRYRTASISEKSLRYCEAKPEFYAPEHCAQAYIDTLRRSFEYYQKAMERGISKEQARGALPVSIFSSAMFTMNLRNLFHLWDQRIDRHAQAETRFIAEQMLERAKEIFPLAVGAYIGCREQVTQTT